MSSKNKIIAFLSAVSNESISNELMTEYDIAKRTHYLEDWEKSILHSGKFCELSLALVKCIKDKEPVDINAIYFDKLFSELTNRKKETAEDDILLLAIPKCASSVYCLRSKKRVAHVKSINPDFLDSTYSIEACDWILAQVLMACTSSNAEEISSLIFSIMEKQVPFVQQFDDGTLMILKDNLTFKDQFLVSLYKLDRRITKKDLATILMTYPQLINTTAKKLFEEKLIHINPQGILLNSKGLRYVEKEILK